MKITVDDYAVLCDVVERAFHRLPVESDPGNPFWMTSDYARQAANRICQELDLEVEVDDE